MLFRIDPASGKPVYQQLIDQVKLAIAAQKLRPGDQLPTVRDLAIHLRVNRNTIARVYSELEREGVLYTRAGQGSFISDQASPFSLQEQRRQLTQMADDFIAQANLYGLTGEQLKDLIENRLEKILRPGAKTRGPKKEEEQ